MIKNLDFKINKDDILYTRYSSGDNCITHILCKKLNADINKMWILKTKTKDTLHR